MATEKVGAVLLPAGASLRYFTGVKLGLSERLLGAVVPAEGEPVFVSPAFEEPKLRKQLADAAEVRVWEEDHSPWQVVVDLLAERGVTRCAMDDATPYLFVRQLAAAGPGVEWEGAAVMVQPLRATKSAAEVALVRWAMGLTLDVHRRVREMLAPGITNTEVVQAIDRMHREGGADGGSTFAIVAFGVETAYPHGPEGVQTLAEGQTVLVDTGTTVEGYHSDLTRTYVFGEPTPRQRSLWAIEREAQQAAFEAVWPGQPCGAVDRAARAVIERQGFGPLYQTPGLPHRTGHGLGLEIHEPPFLVRGSGTPLVPGMIASIEPMLCVYGEMGIRLEDHFVVTQKGAEWLTTPSASIDAPFG
jgi:Xaa-Pro dipeptidase